MTRLFRCEPSIGGLSLLLAVVLATFVCTIPAYGVTIDATDRGHYEDDGDHDSTNTNYIVGEVPSGSVQYHNFFVFDLSSVSGTIISAELRLRNPAGGFSSTDATETYEIFDVSTSTATLTGGGAGLVAVYADLASGTMYASQVVSAADNGTTIVIPLNAAAISDLNAASGLFAFGGVLTTTVVGGANEFLFGLTGSPSVLADTQLVVTTDETAAVPEPSTFVLAALGLLGLGFIALRRKYRRA